MGDYDYKYNQEAKCPYCNYEDTDSWELSDDGEWTECGSCGKRFGYERHLEVTYSTYKQDCANGLAEHQWEQMHGAPREYFADRERCSGCYDERKKEVVNG
ncbi:Zn ribbon nucleic-acid-binding protein [Pseudarthrobacter oxydans]|uniref:Zn ribbon nucleic-acid-binding protein n=1 Tax=Pseudarthrobacter oxydans TaxID=1671 RepID=A0AAW8NEY1_PSEOX|nr:hypothetical protein [Pseudarthrobacter oxydans]MDR6794717.1 Zn ribbon nucleic-acid-binding protein [Pseudarthrobacter oxydans]MDR7166081.1 Zn ribbon nucleic-acid-binding protein [Pseudarthrobacter oxydans]